MRAASTDDAEAIEHLVPEAAGGNEASWWLLWQMVEPVLLKTVGSPRVIGRMSQNEDDIRNIMVDVMEKLRADDHRRLKMYLDKRSADPRLAFTPWLIVVAKRAAIDYMRAHDEYLDKRRSRNVDSAPGAWVAPGTLPNDSRLGGSRPGMTNRGAALTMLRYAYETLPKDQIGALELWIINATYADMADKLGLDTPKDAERLVRAALERLRRHFRER